MAELTDEQNGVIKGLVNWHKKQNEQKTSLVGFAGTGKTFVIGFLIKQLNIKVSQVYFAAYTGQAALVLKGRVPLYDTSTIHRLIYRVKMEKNKPVFELRTTLPGIKLIIIDEASMISEEIFEDLMSFGIPIIFVGDAGQLSSIGKNKFNVLENPDFRLNQIHRQAEGSPIIHLSMLARTKSKIEPGKYGDNVIVMRKKDTSQKMLDNIYKRSDQVICGYNKTRKEINTRTRELLGFTSNEPQVNDKVVALKNNWEIEVGGIPITNGMTGYVKNIYTSEEMENKNIVIPTDEEVDIFGSKRKKYVPKKKADEKSKKRNREYYGMDIETNFGDNVLFEGLNVLKSGFQEEEEKLFPYEFKLYEQFTFAYGVTCHKSQGSQYDNVALVSEVLDFSEHHLWLYTGVTRAKEKLILLI